MSNKLPAFQFYPGDWRGSKWIKIDPMTPWEFADIPACYVIYEDGLLVYVGQTSNLRTRMRAYSFGLTYGSSLRWWINGKDRYPKRLEVKVRYGSRLGDWAMRELRLIHRLQPTLNCVGSKRKRMENA